MKSLGLNKYIIGDARRIAELLPTKEFVDATITSPPYWNLKDYASTRQIGFGQSYESFLDDLDEIFAGVYRITKDTGSLWIVADTIKHNGDLQLFPFDLARRLKTGGWTLQDIIIWNKDKTLPWSHRGKLRNIFEYILFFSKEQRFQYHLSQVRETLDLKKWWKRYPERYSPQGKAPARTWTIPIPRQGSWGENWVRHFCPLPPDLVRRIVLLTTRPGDVVLDPFAGSGVVLAQAHALERKYVGLDLKKRYQSMFEKTVRPSVKKAERNQKSGASRKASRKRHFSSLIWRLRKTKYAKELLRLYKKSFGGLPMVGAIALSMGARKLKVFMPCRRLRMRPISLYSRLRRLSRKPPLSKYGLSVELSVLTPDARSRRFKPPAALNQHKVLTLYSAAATHKAIRQSSTKAVFESFSLSNGAKCKKWPMIASNVHVSAEDIDVI